MPERQRLAVQLRFGGTGPEWSYRTVGAVMGISPVAALYLVRKGLNWLKANGHSTADLCGTAKAPR